MTTAYVIIHLTIKDPDALIKAGRQHLIDTGIAGDEETAREILDENDHGLALKYLIDPGGSPPGTEILDSTFEI